MRGLILSMGEAVVDVLPAGEGLWRPVAGGSSYNVALALGRLGAPAGFVGRLSRDAQGEKMFADLRTAGVNLDLCARDDRPSPLSLVSPGTQATSARYSIYLDGTAHAPPELLAITMRGAAHLHVSSFSAIAGPWGEAVARALEDATSMTASFDVNIRPGLIPPRVQALALIEQRIERVALVKASDEDLDWLRPDRPAAQTAAAWADRFSCLVVLTEGAGGATAFCRTGSTHCDAFPVQIVDTIGAGDCFVAAVLSRAVGQNLLRPDTSGPELGAWLDYANAAAAICCSRAGADPPTHSETRALLNSFGRASACI